MAEEDTLLGQRAEVALDDKKSSDVNSEDTAFDPLVMKVNTFFQTAKTYRRNVEQRWVKAYLNYRAMYGKDVAFTSTEKSRAFVKITKTKSLAAYGQILDIIFSDGEVPITIQATEVPEDVPEAVHIDGTQPTALGFPGDGEDLEPGETLLGRAGKVLTKVKDATLNLGYGKKPTDLNLKPAETAAGKMNTKIQDQFTESRAIPEMKRAFLEMVILGTGIIKGPFVVTREIPKWDEDHTYTPEFEKSPMIEAVSAWHFYPNPQATSKSNLDECVQRHKFTVKQLRDLKNHTNVRENAVEECITHGPNWEREWWEGDLEESDSVTSDDFYQVFEYWGYSAVKDLKETGLPLGDLEVLKETDMLQVNIWVCGNVLLRVTLNPFKPSDIPYHFPIYEEDPYNFFGVGLPENMEDTQTLMNGFTRMAVDNAVLSGNLLIEVDESSLQPGQSLEVYPGRVFVRQSGAPGQAIFGTKFPNTANENMLLFDKFRQLADDATGIPSFAHGQTGVSGVGRTASGISMLLGAASLNIRTVVKNIDDFLLKPLGESFYYWNMNFTNDDTIKGDFEVKPRGTSGLLQKEIKTQKILQLIQVASANPAVAPIFNFKDAFKELAKLLDIDPDSVILDPVEAQIQAQLLGAAGGIPGAPQAGVSDQTGGGGGNIAPGVPQTPGSEQFTGTPQGAGGGGGTGGGGV